MAIGDDASAAGLPLVPDSGIDGRVRYGAREINRTRDMIASVMLGVRAIAKGGTGGTTPAEARANLGVPKITVVSNIPNNADVNDGDIHIRYTV